MEFFKLYKDFFLYDKLFPYLENYDADGRHLVFFPKGKKGHFGQKTFFYSVYRENDSNSYKISLLGTFIIFTEGLNAKKLQ